MNKNTDNTHKNINTNETELNKFNQLSKEWWDTQGPMKSLHQINPLRLEFIQKHRALENQHMLDVGCGGGIFTEALSSHCAHITGIDMAADLLSVAQDHALKNTDLKNPPSYILSTAEDYATLHPAAFDIITCMEMLEHVPDPGSIINSLSTLLKPGGGLFLSTLNRNLTSYLKAIIGAEYILKLLPKGTHDYQSFLKPSELSAMAKKAGLELHALKGIDYHLFKQSFFLSDDIRVNYLMYFKKI